MTNEQNLCYKILLEQSRNFIFIRRNEPLIPSLKMKAPNYLLKFVGIGLIVYAVSFIANPLLLAKMIGFTHHSPNTLVEITAFYGGLELGLGIYFIWTSLKSERYYIGLMSFFFAFFAAGIFRLIGIFLYGFEDPSQPIVSAIEILLPLYGLYLARKI